MGEIKGIMFPSDKKTKTLKGKKKKSQRVTKTMGY